MVLADVIKGLESLNLKKDVYFIVGLKPVANDYIQVVTAQKRIIGNRKETALSLLNRGNEAFRAPHTLLFDWMSGSPKGILESFPQIGFSLDEIEAMVKAYDPSGPTGSQSLIYPVGKTVASMKGRDGEDLTPVITVTEVTETQIRNGSFFTEAGKNQEERIRQALEEDYNVMRTSSKDDAEYIVSGDTGDRIYRFNRTDFVENKAKDVLVENKMSESRYNAQRNASPASKEVSPEEVFSAVEGLVE